MDPIADLLSRVEHVAEADDADLAEIEADALDLFARVRAGEIEGVEHDDVEALTRLRDAVQTVRAEAETRLAAAAEREAEIAALEADLVASNGDDDDDDDEDGDDEITVEAVEEVVAEAEQVAAQAAEEPEPVTAAASPALPALGDVARRSPSRAPRIEMNTALDRTIRLVSAGRDVPWDEFVQALVDVRESFAAYSGAGTDKIRVGRFDWTGDYDDERVLHEGDDRGNTRKVNALAAAAMLPDSWDANGNPQGALVASGGFCAPTPAVYDLAQISGAQRPVRDSLPSFNADRGGVRFTTPPNLAGVLVDQAGGAVGEWTNATDTTPGENTKTVQTIACGEVVEALTKAIYEHVQIGNFMTRAYPEWVSTWMDNVMAAWARKAEQELLDAIDAASTAVTQAQFFGTTRDVLAAIVQLAVAERNRQRMDPNARLRLLIPAWVVGSMQMDLMRQGYSPASAFDVASPESIRALFGAVGVNAAFYEDTRTGAGQVVAAQGAGENMRDLPTTVEWYLFHEGAHVFLDGGTLDLGLVRDSTLVSTNDYRIFSESWEGHAFRGIFSYRVRSVICPSGAGSLGEDSTGICAAS